MIIRILLYLIVPLLLSRAFWRVVSNIVSSFKEGLTGQPSGSSSAPAPPQQGVQMARDPVCGTFVLPSRAVSIADGRTRMYFCSEACRNRYRARTA